MSSRLSVRDAIDALARDPLRHVVLLKQLLAYPGHVQVHRVSSVAGAGILVALDVSASAYDRHAYPGAAVAAFIASDHQDLTAALLPSLPSDVGIVFKLPLETDPAPIRARFALTRRTAFVSFTSIGGGHEPDPAVRITSKPGDAAFALFGKQDHERAWLEPMLDAGKAFACVLDADGETPAACFAFENYGPVWEVGGVVTAAAHRRRGFAMRVVRTALAELRQRGLSPRYQVEESNVASIQLARSADLVSFLTIIHYAHGC